jgi:PAS domain-containing protein
MKPMKSTVERTDREVVRENTANPIRDAEDRVVSFLELARDVTKRKQMEETL